MKKFIKIIALILVFVLAYLIGSINISTWFEIQKDENVSSKNSPFQLLLSNHQLPSLERLEKQTTQKTLAHDSH